METQSAAFHQAMQQAPELRTALVRALAGCVELLHIVSSARGHVATLCGFVEAGAVEAVCRLLQRHKSNKEVQRRGLFCVSCLVHHGGLAQPLDMLGYAEIVNGSSGLALPCVALHDM